MPDPAVLELEPEAVREQEQTTNEVEALVEEELLVEDVSIDGMCGVY